MSAHDTTHHVHGEEPRSKTAFAASFWFVIILVGLFIAALNFISVMGHDAEGHDAEHATHEAAAAHEGGHEAAAPEEHAGGHAAQGAAADSSMHEAEAAH